jgi:glycosyltransferase involved in cell wall biosynthesis
MSVSVIIPTFNRKNLIGQTLNSVLDQTYKPAEVIVVDDHSTDGTFEYLKANFPDVIVVKNEGKGPGAARNRGVSIATGSYIKFFDSDDVMTTNSLEAQLKTLMTSGKQFVYSSYFKATQNNEGHWQPIDDIIMHYYPFSQYNALSWFMIVDGLFITVPGMLLTKELVREVGPWRQDTTAYEDFDYLFRLSLVEELPAHTNQCAFIYRVHGVQSTETNLTDEQRDRDKIKVLHDLYPKARQLGKISHLFYANKFYELFLHSKSFAIRRELNEYNTTGNVALGALLRMKWRIGRYATKTSWQPSHGPLTSSAKISEYLNQLN